MDHGDVCTQLEQLSLDGDSAGLARLLEDSSLPTAAVAHVLSEIGEKATSAAQLQCVEALLSRGGAVSSERLSPLLFSAAKLCVRPLVSSLLALGCSPNMRDSVRKTPLMHVLECQSPEVATTCQELIVHGADTAATDLRGNSPLHYASQSGHFKAVQMLVDSRAPVMGRNEAGDTPLHLAVRQRQRDVALWLVSAGANPACENSLGDCPLSEAEPDTKLVNELRREYAKAQRHEPTSHYKSKKHENGRGGNKKTSAWRQVQRPFTAAKPPEEQKPLEWKQLQEENTKLRDANTQAESQLSALRYILDQRSQELERCKRKTEAFQGSFLFPVAPQQLTPDKLQPALQSDMQRYVKEVEAWQESATPLLEALVCDLQSLVKRLWAEGEVHVYGSFANRLHLPSSDLDVVIEGAKCDSVTALSRIESELLRDKRIGVTTLISTAYIPLLKVQAQLPQLKVMIDISVDQHNHSGKSCNSLVLAYLTRYKVLRPVLLVLKQVLYQFEFHEPFKGGLGSYGLVLMTVFAFQAKGPAWEAIVCTDNSQMALALIEVLKYYAGTFQFLTPIYPKDATASSAKSHSDFCLVPPTQTDSPYLIITDPLNEENNVGRNTNLPRLQVPLTQAIFKACYKSLLRPTHTSGSTLLRMLHEAKYFLPEER